MSIYICLLIELELLAGKTDIFIGEQYKNGLRALPRLFSNLPEPWRETRERGQME